MTTDTGKLELEIARDRESSFDLQLIAKYQRRFPGFDEKILAVFPEATIQTCIVHLLRHSLDFVSYKDRRTVAAALKDIYRAVDYRAVDAAAGEAALTASRKAPGAGGTRR